MFDDGESPDMRRPSIARVYDYMLGGSHNFAVDREFAARVQAQLPGVVGMYASNRAFLRRVVRFCVHDGVHQFLDLGSGIPTVQAVHEVARAVVPDARVAYVDIEPVAVAHGEQILAGVDGVGVAAADLRDPAAVLAAPAVRSVLDLERPVAVLFNAVLHFVPDDGDPAGVVSAYRDAMTGGGLIAISHGSDDLTDPDARDMMRRGERLYRDSDSPLHLRDRAAISALAGGLQLVGPGLVELHEWRPDPDEPLSPGLSGGLGLVGRVPARD